MMSNQWALYEAIKRSDHELSICSNRRFKLSAIFRCTSTASASTAATAASVVDATVVDATVVGATVADALPASHIATCPAADDAADEKTVAAELSKASEERSKAAADSHSRC
jgi:hypothetical protein